MIEIYKKDVSHVQYLVSVLKTSIEGNNLRKGSDVAQEISDETRRLSNAMYVSSRVSGTVKGKSNVLG